MTQPSAPKNIVFYADDDQDDLDLVLEAFQKFTRNVDVVTARDGSEALSWLQATDHQIRPCLIILDINMPYFSGKEVLRKIRSMDLLKDVPAILFTTSSLQNDQGLAKKFNAGFVTKPLDFDQMEMITDIFIDHCAENVRNDIRRHLQ